MSWESALLKHSFRKCNNMYSHPSSLVLEFYWCEKSKVYATSNPNITIKNICYMLHNIDKSFQNKKWNLIPWLKFKKLTWHVSNSSENTIKIIQVTSSHVLCILGRWIFDANNAYAIPLSQVALHRCICNVKGNYEEMTENVVEIDIIAGYEFTIPTAILNKMITCNN